MILNNIQKVQKFRGNLSTYYQNSQNNYFPINSTNNIHSVVNFLHLGKEFIKLCHSQLNLNPLPFTTSLAFQSKSQLYKTVAMIFSFSCLSFFALFIQQGWVIQRIIDADQIQKLLLANLHQKSSNLQGRILFFTVFIFIYLNYYQQRKAKIMGKPKGKSHNNNIYKFAGTTEVKQSQTSIFSFMMQIISWILIIINYFLMFINYGMLIYQTVLILNDENKRLFNLRQIILKWIIVVLVSSLCSFIGPALYFENIISLIGNIIQFLVIYPSEFWKSFLLKYFLKNRNLQEIDFKHFGAIAISKIISWITDLILFIHPKNRQPIYEACVKLQTVLEKEQYLWADLPKQQANIYNLNYSRNYRINKYIHKTPQENSSIDNTHSFLQQIQTIKNGNIQKTSSQKKDQQFRERFLEPSPIKKRNITISLHQNSIMKEKELIQIPKTPTSTITAMVSQMIEIMPPTKYSNPETRFAFFRELMISYNPILAQMKLTVLATNKIIQGQLTEVSLIEDDILQIKLHDQHSYFLKFLSQKQCAAFVNAIEKGEEKWSKVA